MTIPIQEVFTYPHKSHTLRVDDGQVVLGDSTIIGGASFQWALLDDTGTVMATGRNALTDEQYAAWGEDDSYVARCVAANVGLVPL